MRRDTIAAVLFVLAIGLKVLLPAGAFAYASHAPNRESALQDCLSAGSDGDGGHAHPLGKGERHAAGCPLCQLSSEGAFALTGRAPLSAPVALFNRAASFWTASSVAPARPLASAHQPRAPPLF